MKEVEFIDPEMLRQAQDALAAHMLAMSSEPFDLEKAEAGAVLLLMCVGIGYDQSPPGQEQPRRDGVAEALLRAGADEDHAARLADAIACRDIARKTGPFVTPRFRPRTFLRRVIDEYTED
jgi:hypothetical protein